MSYIGCKIRYPCSQDSRKGQFDRSIDSPRPEKKLSMTSLITWNISKVLETCPSLDLKSAMRSANDLLEREARDGAPMMSLQPEEQYLTCALLAWRQLGHQNPDSLYEFIESNKVNENVSNIKIMKQRSTIIKGPLTDGSCFDINTPRGPVVKLPLDKKIVMHVENHYQCVPGHPVIKCKIEKEKEKENAKEKKSKEDVKSKIDAACCTGPKYAAKLSELDKMTAELRSRASSLAKREADRIELLERAEIAWRDLEIGYQRRLRLAKEKENDINVQTKRILDERNAYKDFCKTLMEDLRKRNAEAEAARDQLTKLNEEVCCYACTRLKLSEEAAQGDAAVAEAHCRITQMDRDLQMKEQQARRSILSLENEIACNRGLLLEAERVIRADLSAIKQNIKIVTDESINTENKNNTLKTELDHLSQNKMDMIEDLERCRLKCDTEMQSKLDELKSKKKQLAELNERVLECRCKVPLDASIEVKRTPSFVALCSCMEEDKISDSCSCTSLRSQLMSNLLADLFDGLQSELGVGGSSIPCQLLKCLVDGHNWDRASTLKTNLQDYFSKMLVGELDIAIATSIEKCHARWVGDSCVDNERAQDEREWQERAVEQRAQELTSSLAEQLFNERAEELANRARELASCGPHCNSAVYPCLVKAPTTRKITDASYLKRKLNDVTQLRVQIEELKKESIKKEDLRHLEDKLTRTIHRASRLNTKLKNKNKCDPTLYTNTDDKPEKEKDGEPASYNKGIDKLEEFDSCYIKSNFFLKYNRGGVVKHRRKKDVKKIGESYAVNMCLCDGKNTSNNVTNVLKELEEKKKNVLKESNKNLSPRKQDYLSNNESRKQSFASSKSNANVTSEVPKQICCPGGCACFHKVPSNTSINNFLKGITELSCSFNQNVKKSNQDLKNIGPYSKNTAVVNSTSDCLSDPLATNNDHVKKDSKNSTANFKEHFKNIVPIVSEYVGAINLDKSNEDLCNCDSKTDGWKNNTVIKCIPNIKEISQDKINLNLKDDKANKNYEKENMENLCDCIDKKILGIEFNLKDDKVNQNYNEGICTDCSEGFEINRKDVHGEMHIADRKKNSDIFTDDYQCSVKLLGVTIADNSNNKIYPTVIPNKQFDKDDKSQSTICRDFDNAQESKFVNKSKEISTCILENVRDSCVCCNKDANVSDIEVNVFSLLKEHLKGKIEDIKQTSVSPISPVEEEKIYINILNEVKQLITDSTYEVSCKCWFKGNEGSWTRAYDLLKEYLKIKIERAQCSCNTGNNANTVLPSLLEKVSALIESDFECLKIKYKGGSISDTLRMHNEEDRNDENMNERSFSYAKITDNCSAQVSCNFNSHHKSSDPIYENQYINKIEKKLSCDLNRNVYVTDCECCYSFIKNDQNNQIETSKLKTEIKEYDDNNVKNAPDNQTEINKLQRHTYETDSNTENNMKLKNCSGTFGTLSHTSCPSLESRIDRKSPAEGIDEQIQCSCTSIMNKDGTYIKPDTNRDKTQKYVLCKNVNTDYNSNIVLKNSSIANNGTFKDSGTLYEIRGDNFDPTSRDTALIKETLLAFPATTLSNNADGCVGICSNLCTCCNCNCENVPICHVKMLVDDIKNKLIHSECICDTLSAEVCPLHSKNVLK